MVQDVRKHLEAEITLPIKVAVMGCVVNGPGEAEGADVAIFAGDRKGIIYVQGREGGEQRAGGGDFAPAAGRVPGKFQDQVARGEAKLGEKKVDILPPDPIGEIGSGWEKIQKEKGARGLPVLS